MKKVKLSTLKDNARFSLTNAKLSITYRLHKLKAGKAYFSSETSNRTYSRAANTFVFIK